MKARLVAATFFSALVFICNAAPASETPDPQPKAENTKPCFQCSGNGTSKCPAPTCANGKVDCPAQCIKLRKGVWKKHPELRRPDPNELMQDITVNDHYLQVSSHHEGVRYVWANGAPQMQTCPVCNGTTRVQCKVCAGKGIITCPICAGKKVVPESWSTFDNPKMKNRPSRFTLKDGSVVIGHTKMAAGTTIIIRTEKGEEKLEASNIVSEEKQPTQK